ncbi:MAG TPA: hypothetical protein PKD05_15425 [Candidatus Melainabacteria bacterium]|nr:hypothetical protein [Candidatus Melainabacteria bacterium]
MFLIALYQVAARQAYFFKKFESSGHVGDRGQIGHNKRQAVNTEYGDNCDKEIPATI